MIDAQEKSFKRLESADFKESPRHFTGFIALTEDSFWRLIDDSRAKNQESFDSQMDYLILQHHDQRIFVYFVLKAKHHLNLFP